MPRNYHRGQKRKSSAKAKPLRTQQQSSNSNNKNSKSTHPHNFRQQLQFFGLQLKDIEGDGNCLFRALGDQLNGDTLRHHQHRRDVVNFMRDHRDDFEPFFFGESENSASFEQHLKELAKPGVHAGNDVLVAFSRLHSLDIVVHQVNKSPWCIHGGGSRQLHIAFHEDRDHYSSIRQLGDMTDTPTKIRLQPADLEKVPEIQNNNSDDEIDDDYADESISDRAPDHGPDSDCVEALVKEAMCISGCADEELVRDILNTFNYQLEETVDYLLNVSSCDNDKSSSPPCDDYCDADDEETVDTEATPRGAACSSSRSTARTKRANKQVKRERAIQRRRRERGIDESTGGHTSSDEYIINGLSVLNL